MRSFLLLILFCLFGWAGLQAQYKLTCTNTGLRYEQDFNGLSPQTNSPCGGPQEAWTDNTTLLGWYRATISGTPRFLASSGHCNTGAFYNFGPNGGPLGSDRAMGSINSGTNQTAFGLRLENNTQMTIRQIVVNYTGEQWRRGTNTANAADRLDFQYKIGPPGSINIGDAATDPSWINVDALDFNSPFTATFNGPLDGNDPANRTAISHTLTGLNVPQGQEIWFRWVPFDVGGEDDGLGIDDLSIIVDREQQWGTCGITPPGSTVCASQQPPLLTVNCSSGLPPIVGWDRSTDPGFSPQTTDFAATTSTYQPPALNQTTYYRPAFRVAAGCPIFRIPSVVHTATLDNSVNGGVMTVGSPSTICSGATPLPRLTLTGYVGTILNWEKSIDGFVTSTLLNHSQDFYDPPGTLTTTTCYRAVVQGSAGCPPANSTNGCITVDQPTDVRTIRTVSNAPTTICSGQNSPQLILGPGNGSVQNWERSTDNFATSTTTSVTTTNLDPGPLTQTTCFRAVLQNGACAPANSETLCITVRPAATGGTLTADQTVCITDTPAPLALTGHSGVIVRWERSTDNFTTKTVINTTTPTLTFTANPGVTTRYRAVLSPDASCPAANEVNSPAVQITVSPQTVAGALGVLGNATVCSGSSANLQLVGGVGAVIRWERSTDNFATTPTTLSQTTTALPTGPLAQRTSFRVVQQSGACPERTSTSVAIDVDETSLGGTLSGGGTTVCDINNAPQLSLTGLRGQIVRWESSLDNFATAGTPIAHTQNTYDPGILPVSTCFRAAVKNGECPEAFSNVQCFDAITCRDAKLVSLSVPVVDLCTAPVTVTVQGLDTDFLNHTAVIFSRRPDAIDPVGTGINRVSISATELSFDVPPTAPVGTWWLIIENGGEQQIQGIPFPKPLEITITGPVGVVGGAVTSNATVCSGNNSGLLTLVGSAGPIVRWERSENNFNTFTTIDNQTTQQDYKDLFETTWFRAVLDGGNCPVYSAPARISMDPAARGGRVFSDRQVCGNSTAGVLLLLNPVGTIRGWEASTDSFATNRTLIPSTTPNLAFNVRQTTWYRSVVVGGNCTAYSRPARIKIDPLPVQGSLGPDLEVCASQPDGLLRLSNFSGDIEHWESSTNGFATATTIANTSDEYAFSGLTQDTEFRVRLSRQGSCQLYSRTVKVRVRPEAVAGTLNGTTTACGLPNSGNLTLAGFTGQVLRWETSTDDFASFTTLANTTPNLGWSDIDRRTCWRVRVGSGSRVCPEVVSNSVCIDYRSLDFTGSLAPKRQAVCAGNAAQPLVLTGATGTVVGWESSTDCAGFSNPTPIAETSTELNPGTPTQTTCYRARVQDAVCGIRTTEAVQVAVSNLQFNPVVTQVNGCQSLGRIEANATGGLSGSVIYTIDSRPGQVSLTGVFDDLLPGTYTIQAIDPAARCTVSTTADILPLTNTLTLTSAAASQTSLDIEWPPVPAASQPTYTLRYRIKGSSQWTTVFNIRQPNRRLTGLQPGTEYEIQVSFSCPNGLQTDWSSVASFRTVSSGDCSTTPRGTVEGIYVDQIGPQTATIYYTRTAGAKGYLIQVGLASLPINTWPTYPVCDPQDQLTLTGLVPGRSYRVRITPHCEACNSARFAGRGTPSMVIQFTTPLFRKGEEPVQAAGRTADRLTVYPNPSNGLLTLDLDVSTAGLRTLQVFDLTGRRLWNERLDLVAGRQELPLDLTALPAGIYLLRVGDGPMALQVKLILQ